MSTLDPRANEREIVNTRVLDAPPRRVFEVWTTPEHLAAWWGPNGFTTTTHALDARPGGTWRFTMHGPDGRDYENRIEFLEIVEPNLIVYRHTGDEDVEPVRFQVTVSFVPIGDSKTLLTLRAVFDTPGDLEQTELSYGAVAGSIETLARLAEHVGRVEETV